MKLRKFLLPVILFFAMFTLLGGIPKLSFAYDPNWKCDDADNDSTHNVINTSSFVCSDERRTEAHLTPCPDLESDLQGGWSTGRRIRYCKSDEWVEDCMVRFFIREGDSTEHIAFDLNNCAADPDAFGTVDSWWRGTKKVGYRKSCDSCLEYCAFSTLMGDSAKRLILFDECAQKNGADGRQPCRAYFPDHTPQVWVGNDDEGMRKKSEGGRFCLREEWIDDWVDDFKLEVFDEPRRKWFCDYACDNQYPVVEKKEENESCKKSCLAAQNEADMINAVKNAGVDLKTVAASATANIAKTLSKYSGKIATNTITNAYLKGGFGYSLGPGGLNIKSFTKLLLTSFSGILGGLGIVKIVMGGILYATAMGNPQKLTEAKSHILYAIIGLTLIICLNIVVYVLGVTPL